MTDERKAEEGRALVEITIEDTLAFYRPDADTYVVNPSVRPKKSTWVYDVPATLVADGALTEAGLERVFAQLYGPTWRQGNADGSRYTVISVVSRRVPSTDSRVLRLD